jgi:hypothetical protein
MMKLLVGVVEKEDNNFVARNHDLVARNHDLVARNHDLVARNHDLADKIYGTKLTTVATS